MPQEAGMGARHLEQQQRWGAESVVVSVKTLLDLSK